MAGEILGFSDYMAERTRDFTGREWVFAEIDAWLADANASRYFIITGEPGIGKTAIAARLSQFSGGDAMPPVDYAWVGVGFLSAVHFCSTRHGGWISPDGFARSLSAQLAGRYPAFADALASYLHIHVEQKAGTVSGTMIGVQITNYYAETSEALFNDLVRTPLQALCSDASFSTPLAILVDGLDESLSYSGRTNIVRLLVACRDLPSQVRLLLTSRPVDAVLEPFRPLQPFILYACSEENQADVGTYVDHRFATSPTLRDQAGDEAQVERVRNSLVARSGGNFLVVSKVLEGAERGELSLADPEELPAALQDLYAWFLDRLIQGDLRLWRSYFRPVLGVLTVAREPVDASTLCRWANLTNQQVSDVLHDLREFLDPALEGRYRLYHESVVDFLTGDGAGPYSLNAAEYHWQIASSYTQRFLEDGEEWLACDHYGLRYLAGHLLAARQWRFLALLASDDEFMEQQRRVGLGLTATNDILRLGVHGGLMLQDPSLVIEVSAQWRKYFTAARLVDQFPSIDQLGPQETKDLLDVVRSAAGNVFCPRFSMILAWGALRASDTELCAQGVAQFLECSDGYLAYEESHLFAPFFLLAWERAVPGIEEAWLRAYPVCFAATSILRSILASSPDIPQSLVRLYNALSARSPDSLRRLADRPARSDVEKALQGSIKAEMDATRYSGGIIGKLLNLDLDALPDVALPVYIEALRKELGAQRTFSLDEPLSQVYRRVVRGEPLSLSLAHLVGLPDIQHRGFLSRARSFETAVETIDKIRVAEVGELALIARNIADSTDGVKDLVMRITEWAKLARQESFLMGGGSTPFREPSREEWVVDLRMISCLFDLAEKYAFDDDLVYRIAYASRFFAYQDELMDARAARGATLVRDAMPTSLIRELLESRPHGTGMVSGSRATDIALALSQRPKSRAREELKKMFGIIADLSAPPGIQDFNALGANDTLQLIQEHLAEIVEPSELYLAAVLAAIWSGHTDSLLPSIVKLPASLQRDVLLYVMISHVPGVNALQFIPLVSSPYLRYAAARLLGARLGLSFSFDVQRVTGLDEVLSLISNATTSVSKDEIAVETVALYGISLLQAWLRRQQSQFDIGF